MALIGLAFEFSLDGITSVFVLWRFQEERISASSNNGSRGTHNADAAKRERNANLAVGVAFLASATVLIISAIYKLSSWIVNKHVKEIKEESSIAEMFAYPCFFLFGAFAWYKANLARELNSSVLKRDAF